MTMTYINELPRHVGETVTLRGWVMTTRSSGKIAFLVLRDGSGYVQACFPSGKYPRTPGPSSCRLRRKPRSP
jgi:asparaginyl-tRNA synthetase